MKLATIETEKGQMEISLVDVPETCNRMLVGTIEDTDAEHNVTEVIQEGFATGNAGIVDAIEAIGDMYRVRTWGLQMLADWRDYVAA
jgi:hypothetical protein